MRQVKKARQPSCGFKEMLREFLLRCLQYFNLGSVHFTYVDKDFDIYCEFPNRIYAGRWWKKALEKNEDEAKKRIVHEFIHLALGLPDNLIEFCYFSHPWNDFFSAVVYEDMLKHKRFDWVRVLSALKEKVQDEEWVKKWRESGKLGWPEVKLTALSSEASR